LINASVKERDINHGRVKKFKDLNKPLKFYLLDVCSIIVGIVHFLTLRNSGVLRFFKIAAVFFILLVMLDIVSDYIISFICFRC
jgi:hypothetical protein